MSTASAQVIRLEEVAGDWHNEQLLRRYVVTRSPDILDKVVRANQGLLHHILKRFSHATEPYEDLLQVANLGLIKAAQNYDPVRGVRFSTYATATVDGEIRHHLRDTLLLRQPRWLRRLSVQIEEATIELGHALGRPPEVAEIAAAVNVTPAGVLEVMAQRARIDLHSLDETAAPGRGGALPHKELIRSLRAESFALPIEDRIALDEAIAKLSDSQRRLIELLFYREFTQREVAEALGITTKKVSGELGKALTRLKDLMGKRLF